MISKIFKKVIEVLKRSTKGAIDLLGAIRAGVIAGAMAMASIYVLTVFYNSLPLDTLSSDLQNKVLGILSGIIDAIALSPTVILVLFLVLIIGAILLLGGGGGGGE